MINHAGPSARLYGLGRVVALVAGFCGCGSPEESPPLAPTTTDRPDIPAGPPIGLPSNGRPDSYAYYGMGEGYGPAQKEGRDTWIMWTAGNQKFFRLGSELGGNLGVSIEYFRLLDTRDRATRFQRLGLINEPNCVQASKPDQYGLWLDEWKGDPYDKDKGPSDPKVYPSTEIYGEPSGVVGMRKYPNPKFDRSKWDPKTSPDEFFRNPGKVEPPYLIGMACGFCHMGFHPQRPPLDPANPRWENLAANLGNQYLAEGNVFFGSGKVVYGDQNGGKGSGLDDFFRQYGESQQRGTSETSRLSYDFINNPNTINSIFNLESRPTFAEKYNPVAEAQVRTIVPKPAPLSPIHHVLKDGSDSQGIPIASIRVYANIGMAGAYWIKRLWNPLEPDKSQQPFDMAVAASDPDWKATLARMPNLEKYLATYRPMHLEEIPGATEAGHVIPDRYKDSTNPAEKAKWQIIEAGKVAFADRCAECHSSKPKPGPEIKKGTPEFRAYYRAQVAAPDFLDGNALTDDVRYPLSELKENAGRAMGTNATAGHIWDQFSSPDYKALPPSGVLMLENPVDPTSPREWQPPAGGRGYYRTASLVSIWATAPFLHNNSVGKFPGDLVLPPTEWPQVSGRITAFNDAIEKLLYIQKRDDLTKKVTQDCYVYLRLGNLDAAARQVFDKFDLGPGFDLIHAVKDRVKQDLLGIEPAPDKPTLLKVWVPKDTPINLLANLHAKNREAAIGPFLRYSLARKLQVVLPIQGPILKAQLKRLENKATDELLALSEYPDLIEDHGHDYGNDLSPPDKAALIEYLKKL